MKITKYIDLPGQEIDVEICAADVLTALLEGSEDLTPKHAVIRAANNLAKVFRGLPLSAIEELTINQRELIANFFEEQAKRFRPVVQVVS